jgi:uncharacterized membrane protein
MPTLTQAVEIHARPERVEQVYRKFDAYPEFIAPVTTVKEHDGLIDCNLRVAGFNFPYTARVEQAGPGEYRWETVPGSSIAHQGTTRIEPNGDGTRLTMEVSYAPPGGETVGKMANWLGLADTGLRHALESFKAYVEAH